MVYRLMLAVVLATTHFSLAGCKTAATQVPAEARVMARLELPAHAAPAQQLLPLAFMAGRWISVNPNKTVNEEHWSSPRGNHMVAVYRQIRRDSKPALVEVSLVTVEPATADALSASPASGSESPSKVVLRLRHLHANLEIPENQRELSLFELKSAAENRAEFVGVGGAVQVTSVVYRLTSPDTMTVDVSFAPDSKEKGFTMNYTREALVRQAIAPVVAPADQPKK